MVKKELYWGQFGGGNWRNGSLPWGETQQKTRKKCEDLVMGQPGKGNDPCSGSLVGGSGVHGGALLWALFFEKGKGGGFRGEMFGWNAKRGQYRRSLGGSEPIGRGEGVEKPHKKEESSRKAAWNKGNGGAFRAGKACKRGESSLGSKAQRRDPLTVHKGEHWVNQRKGG